MSFNNNPILAPSLTALPAPSEVKRDEVQQTDTRNHMAEKPIYQYVQTFQSNNGAQTTLSLTSTSQSIFNFSGDTVYNFGRSYLSFNLNLPTPGTAGDNVLLTTDVLPIDSITLQTTAGTVLANIQFAQPFSKVMPALTTSLTSYYSRGPVNLAAASIISENRILQPCNSTTNNQITGLPSSLYIYPTTVAAPVITLSQQSISMDGNSGSDKGYNAKQRYITSLAVGAAGANMVVPYVIPLNYFVGTLLAVDRDVLMGQNLNLIINWAPVNRYVYDCTANLAAVAAYDSATAPFITNLYTWLAKEVNTNIITDYRAKLLTGYTIDTPWTQCSSNSTASTGLFSSNIQIPPGAGTCLKRIVTVPVNPGTNIGNNWLNDNVNAHLYTYLQTFMDSTPIQQVQIQAGQSNMDFDYLRNLIKDTVAGHSLREFQINSFWIDSFSSSLEHGDDILENDTVDDGMVINSSAKNYNFTINFGGSNGQVPGGYLYHFIVYLRKLVVSPMGLSWKQ